MHKALENLYRKIYPYAKQAVTFGIRLAQEGKDYYIQHSVLLIKISIPLLIIGFGYGSCVYSQHIIAKNVQMIFSLSDAVRQHYADKPSYWGLNTDYVIKQGIANRSTIQGNRLRLGGGLTVLIGDGINGDTVMPMAQSFDIVLPNLNKAQCLSYAESELSGNMNIALIRFSITNESGTYVFEWGQKNSLPIEKYATKDLCKDKENTLIWSLK